MAEQMYNNLNFPGVPLPAIDQSKHFGVDSYPLLWNQRAIELGGTDLSRYDGFTADYPATPTFPPGMTGPWTTKAPIKHGFKVVGYLKVTIETGVWQIRDLSKQPVRLSLEMLSNIAAEMPEVKNVLETITGFAQMALFHRWNG